MGNRLVWNRETGIYGGTLFGSEQQSIGFLRDYRRLREHHLHHSNTGGGEIPPSPQNPLFPQKLRSVPLQHSPTATDQTRKRQGSRRSKVRPISLG